MRIDVIDVLQGDSTLIRFPDATILIDAADRFPSRYERVLDLLEAEGVTKIDHFVLTHPDADHTGGCEHVIAAQADPGHPLAEVVNAYYPGWGAPSTWTQTWTKCVNSIHGDPLAPGGSPTAGITGTIYTDADLDPGDLLPWTVQGSVRVLAIDAAASDANDASIVLRFDHGGVSWITTGDADFGVEAGILAAGHDVDADVLQVGHHGSATSTGDAWLDAVTPDMGTISAGAGNPHDHPRDVTLQRLYARSIETCRTDLDGNISWPSDGVSWSHLAPATCQVGPSGDGVPPPGSGPSCTAGVAIVDILHSPATLATDEWVQIDDHGATQDFSGWTLEDLAGTLYAFPAGFTLDCGSSVKVHAGTGTDTATDLYWNRGSAVWNNGGDKAILKDGGALVDEYRYGSVVC